MATRPIDEKIVAMKMDNSDFKRKAAETTGLFGKLTQALNKVPGINLGRTAQEFNNINRSISRVDMSPINSSIDKVSHGFSKLEIMATTALVNITNRAVNAGLALQHSLTTQQVSEGFKEYELKIGSIGTILANTEWAGSTLEDVKGTLEELNQYADLTIYNFAQMTQNIGRFTAAGVTLGDSTTAIKGLGNLAAISGSTSEQLNTAMYQMSQALAAGKLNLMDWNSMVNAGMGGKKTQDALLATAKSMGIAVDMSDGFRNSISEGWLTSKVFLETLKQFGNDESMTEAATKVRTFTQMMETLKEGIGSGWAETWELVFGDFEEATLLWSTLSGLISKPFEASTKARNDFLRDIIKGEALFAIFSGIANATKSISSIFRAIGDGFRLAFPPISVETVLGLTRSFVEFTKGLIFNEKTLKTLTTIFHGVFAIFSSVWEIVKAVGSAFVGLLPGLHGVASGALDILAYVANLSISLNESIKSGELFSKIMGILTTTLTIIGGVILWVVDGFKTLASFMGMSFGMEQISFSESIKSGELLTKAMGAVRWITEQVGNGLDWLNGKLQALGSMMGISFGGEQVAGVNRELLTMKDILSPIAQFFRDMFDAIVVGFEWVKGKLVGFGQMISNALPDGDKLFAGGFIAAMTAIVGVTLKMAWDLYEVFTGWGKIGQGVADTLEGVGDALNAFSWQVRAQALVTIAIGVGLLAVSLFALSRIDPNKLTTGLIGMVTILTAVIGGMAIMSKYDITGAGMKAALTMVAMGMAVVVMAGALKLLSLMDTDEILRGILALGGIMLALSGSITLMSAFGGAKVGASALQIVALSVSIHILVSAVKRMSEINTGDLVKGVTTLGIILIQMGLFFKMAGKSSFGIGSTLGMLAIGQAIINITNAINKIAEIDVKNLIVGLTTIGLILAAIAVFTAITSDKGLFATGVGMMLVAAALTALTVPIAILGSMNMETLVVGMGAMAVALLAIGAASLLMTNMIATGAGLMLVAAALHMFIVPIAALSAMGWPALLTGIGGLALGLLAIGGVSALLGMAAGYIAAFGGALAIVGVAMLAAGAGMALFSSGLVMLSTMTAAAITTIVATFGTLLVGLASMIPMIVDFIVKLFMQLIEVISREVPNIVGLFADMLTKVLEKIGEYIPKIVEAAVKIITNFLDALADNLPSIVESAANLMVAFVESLAAAVELKGPEFLDAIMRLMAAAATLIVDAGVAVVQALFGWIPGVKDATDKIGETADEAIKDAFNIEATGKDKGDEFAKGMEGKSGEVKSAGTTIAESGKDGAESVDMTSSGSYFGQGFANGINSQSGNVSSAAQNLANIAQNEIRTTLDIRSPARETTMLGAYTGQGFANGISSSNKEVSKSANSIAGVLLDAFGVKAPTKKAANKGGKVTSESYAEGVGSKSSKEKVSKAAKSVAKSAADAFRKEMETAKYRFEMEEIDSDQYIAELKRIKKAYAKHGDLVREVNREIKKAEEDAIKKKEELRRKEFENSKSWIDDRKYYNEMSLMEELAAYERVAARYEKGTEERKSADREIYRLKNDINKKLIALNDEYVEKVQEANQKLIEGERDLNQKYEDAVADRTKSLVGFAGIFDEIQSSAEISGEQLIKNLRDQVSTFISWTTNINRLASRGLDQGLVNELREMGPRAAGEIAALTSLTNQQLTEYSNLWKQKNELARAQSVYELEDLRKETEAQIEELRKETGDQLETYKDEWIKKVSEIRTGVADEYIKLSDDMDVIGRDSIRGLINGMDNMTGPLYKKAKSIANTVSETIKTALKIKSPSKITTKLGEYTGEGLAVGLNNKIKDIRNGAKEMASTAKDSLHNFLDGFEIPEEDSELHFKAVIDYDSLDTSRFGNLKPLTVRPDVSLTNRLVAATKADLRQNGNKKSSGNNTNRDSIKNDNKESNQPIIIQSVLNGRVIAEETFNDVNRLLGGRTSLDYVMRG